MEGQAKRIVTIRVDEDEAADLLSILEPLLNDDTYRGMSSPVRARLERLVGYLNLVA